MYYYQRGYSFIIGEDSEMIERVVKFKDRGQNPEESGEFHFRDGLPHSNATNEELTFNLDYFACHRISKLKYIVSESDEKKTITVFSPDFIHKDIASVLRLRPISAGFINSAYECYGRSESLDLDSKIGDTQLFQLL